ncbi:hypothetical protein P7K49_027448 [Saguinus oedipus]|uniref:Uncharacterized protein n=1 Tax=Saguinus oedipus TaxID=9490 RepID=A0ABQ9U9J9_SAGOE|nr:hypothetical protein P7K49_027448 [Saguinus oedipus]
MTLLSYVPKWKGRNESESYLQTNTTVMSYQMTTLSTNRGKGKVDKGFAATPEILWLISTSLAFPVGNESLTLGKLEALVCSTFAPSWLQSRELKLSDAAPVRLAPECQPGQQQ